MPSHRKRVVDTLKVGRARGVKEVFSGLPGYYYTACASWFFDRWGFSDRFAAASGHPRCQDFEAPSHRTPCLQEARITHAVAEGTNGHIQLIKVNVRGWRHFAPYRVTILFHCGLDLYRVGCAL